MATIPYSQTSPFGSKIYLAIQALATAQTNVLRCLDMANDLTGGGVTPANLEGSSQFGVAVNQGANFYNALQSIKSAIVSGGNRLQATIDLDQG